MASKPAPKSPTRFKGATTATYGQKNSRGQKPVKPGALDVQTSKSSLPDWNPRNPKMSPMYGHASKPSPDTLVNSPGFQQSKDPAVDVGNTREFFGQPGNKPAPVRPGPGARPGTKLSDVRGRGVGQSGSGKTVGQATRGTRPGNSAH